tara:strand:- start:2283 stop:2414 length:132 start_codon:yes stop_codon:yes gene_type:complete
MNLGCMILSVFVFFSGETAYIMTMHARSKGRAPSYPEPGDRAD